VVVGGPLEEPELVERAKRGDTEAYRMLVRMHQKTAFRAAYAVTGSAADAEEVVQDAFVKAYRALWRFRRGAPFRPWALKIVVNEARNRRASERRHALVLHLDDELSPGGAAPSSEAAAIAAEERRSLLRAIASLREEERLVVVCRHLLGLSEQETATALGLRVGTAKSRLSRALARLREQLEERDA
jgi:RNA polymerase sigma-70 factor, ECF subfamily